MSRAEIQRMTTEERLLAMEELWDALCQDAAEPASPGWHGNVLEERRRKIDSGEAQFLSLEEVEKRLRL